MKGKVATVALAVLAVCCAPTFADYQSIQHNLINGVGDTTFNATTGVFNVSANLPGSNVWPDGGGFSSVDSLTFAFGQDLSNFDWREDLTGRVETLYSLFPDDRAVPEPATLALLAFGALALARKRR